MRNMDSVPLKDWQFDELVTVITWDVISALANGKPLKSAIHSALQFAMQWEGERQAKQRDKA